MEVEIRNGKIVMQIGDVQVEIWKKSGNIEMQMKPMFGLPEGVQMGYSEFMAKDDVPGTSYFKNDRVYLVHGIDGIRYAFVGDPDVLYKNRALLIEHAMIRSIGCSCEDVEWMLDMILDAIKWMPVWLAEKIYKVWQVLVENKDVIENALFLLEIKDGR